MFKKTVVLLVVVAVLLLGWVAFALWTGMYSLYSFPPSGEYPEGTTLLVHREPGEPMFNSPQYIPPKPKEDPSGGIFKFAPSTRPKRPLELRTIVELPFMEWAYNKSLEPATPE